MDANLICPRCQIGHLQTVKLTYTRMLGDHLVSIPDVAAWRCDICGLQEFAADALLHIDSLLDDQDPPETPRNTGRSPDIRPHK